jgi:hypothetical protein
MQWYLFVSQTDELAHNKKPIAEERLNSSYRILLLP